ncbi:MAG: zinc-ribbon domain-containing protein, partial [Candidatus Thermoplasmatota archaeon]|nr:zinc-ribbon domain-containing protein [Candidatus Thermoplasmatota archaeon]
MECGSCGAVIPDDSIFCSECGARQEFSRAGSFSAMGSQSLGGGEVTGGRGFGVVSGEAVRQQRDMQQQGMPQGIPADILQNIASGIQQQNNLPPGSQLPPQQPSQFPNQMSNQFPQQQPFIPQGQPMPQGMPINSQQSDSPQQPRGPTIASGAVPSTNVESQLGQQLGGTTVTNNPTASPTDAMVNRLAEAERAVKNERRSQWLNMNQSSASNVLANLGADLPSHLKDAQGITPAAEVLAGTMNQSSSDGPNDALLRRMCEVASRRVARKRGVAVETPEAKVVDGALIVNLTYVDDGRVLDTPEDLTSAFEHAIQTEVALKGYDMAVEIV